MEYRRDGLWSSSHVGCKPPQTPIPTEMEPCLPNSSIQRFCSLELLSRWSWVLLQCHFRVGGATGTQLQVAQCPTSLISSECFAASLLFHVTGNGYFENVWAWTADHDIDDPNQTQINVITGRSVLIESSGGPSWFYATAAEHSLLYQYNIVNSSDIFMGMVSKTGHLKHQFLGIHKGLHSHRFKPKVHIIHQSCPLLKHLALCHTTYSLLIPTSLTVRMPAVLCLGLSSSAHRAIYTSRVLDCIAGLATTISKSAKTVKTANWHLW